MEIAYIFKKWAPHTLPWKGQVLSRTRKEEECSIASVCPCGLLVTDPGYIHWGNALFQHHLSELLLQLNMATWLSPANEMNGKVIS